MKANKSTAATKLNPLQKRIFRLYATMTMAEIAKQLGMSTTWVFNQLNGCSGGIYKCHAASISKGLGITTQQVLSDANHSHC